MDHPEHIKTKVLPELIKLLNYYSRRISYAGNGPASGSEAIGWIESSRVVLDTAAPSKVELAACIRHLISNLQNLKAPEQSGIEQDMLEELTLFQLRHGLEQNHTKS